MSQDWRFYGAKKDLVKDLCQGFESQDAVNYSGNCAGRLDAVICLVASRRRVADRNNSLVSKISDDRLSSNQRKRQW